MPLSTAQNGRLLGLVMQFSSGNAHEIQLRTSIRYTDGFVEGGLRTTADSSPRHIEPARAGVYTGTAPTATAQHPCMDVEPQPVRLCASSRTVSASSMRAHPALTTCVFRRPASAEQRSMHGCRRGALSRANTHDCRNQGGWALKMWTFATRKQGAGAYLGC